MKHSSRPSVQAVSATATAITAAVSIVGIAATLAHALVSASRR